MSVEGYPDDFEQGSHLESEWDEYQKAKMKQGKVGPMKPMDYKAYKSKLVFRNLAFNFKKNTQGLANKVAPVLEGMAKNAAANADSLVDSQPTATKGKHGTKKQGA